MFDQVIISFIGRVYRYAAFTPKGYVSFHPSQYHVGPFSGLHAIQEREEEGHRGYHANKKRSALLLLASGAGEGVGDALASVAESVLGLLHDALALIAAGAGCVAELLSGGLLALWCVMLVHVRCSKEKRGGIVPGWTAPAIRSPAPVRLSLAFSVVDF